MSDAELLQIKGVGRVTAARLVEAGLGTVADVASATLDRLVEVTRFPPARATAIRQAAARLAPPAPAAEPRAKAGTGIADEKKKPKGKKVDKKKKKKAAKDKPKKKEKSGKKGKSKGKSKKKGKGGKKDKAGKKSKKGKSGKKSKGKKKG